jgi:uncharacterized membrane protein
MGYFLIAPFLTIAFLGWVLYHFLIKKNLKQQRNELFGGLVFIGLWIVIYALVVNV